MTTASASDPALSGHDRPLDVAIVGSGPAGMHCVAQILTALPSVRIDVFEQRAVPYGLVRHGTAPDHAEGDVLAERFEGLTDDPRVRLLGGVEVGAEVSRAELLAHYDAVVWAIGAIAPRHLGIPGEELPGVCTADDFYGWYTGQVDAPRFSLAGVRQVVVVGFGDVGQDIARVLLKPAESFVGTHMPPAVLAELRSHRVQRVSVLNRSGATRLKLKPRVLRELVALPEVAVELDPARLGPLPEGIDRRIRESVTALEEAARRDSRAATGRLHIALSQRPVEILGSGHVEAVRVERTDTPAGAGTGGDAPQLHEYPAQLVVTAVGDDVVRVPQLPWDPATRTIPAAGPRLTDELGVLQPREYVTGWARHGNVAGFGSTRRDAGEVIEALLADREAGLLVAAEPGPEQVQALLTRRGVRPVGWADWHRLTDVETARGALLGRPSARITDPREQDEILHPEQ